VRFLWVAAVAMSPSFVSRVVRSVSSRLAGGRAVDVARDGTSLRVPSAEGRFWKGAESHSAYARRAPLGGSVRESVREWRAEPDRKPP